MKTILVDAVDTFIIEGQGVYQPLFELLEKYPNPKIILTNANDAQIPQFGLVNLPYELFTLKHNPDKTDPQYFHQMLANYQLKPEDVIYFEHNPQAVDSARSVGITSYYYDPHTKDLVSLKQFLDQNINF
jgi:HAD superfamily hydrolase (TIGR01509 family)